MMIVRALGAPGSSRLSKRAAKATHYQHSRQQSSTFTQCWRLVTGFRPGKEHSRRLRGMLLATTWQRFIDVPTHTRGIANVFWGCGQCLNILLLKEPGF